MQKPFKQDFKLTQGFGENPASYAKFNMKGHNGLDYGLPSGTDVVAPHSGKVIEVAYDEFGYGNYIKIENDKEGSVLAHLQESLVSIGTVVSEGQLIAHSDNTGNSTGPHLHWGYYTFPRNRQNGYAGFIDQLPLIPKPDTGVFISQKELDQIRAERDRNWNMFIETDKLLKEAQQKITDHKCPDNKQVKKDLHELVDKIQ
jgi:murein DD-endopeptidase MepM/ murein hydrolase activator NlpD